MFARSAFLSPSDELQPFILHVPYLGLGHQHQTVQREGGDVGGDPACVLLGLEGQDDLVVRVGDELERGEAVGGVERPHVPHRYVAEVCGAGQQQVGGSPLVRRLLVVVVTGTAREEEPALETLAPRRRLMDKVAWRTRTGQSVMQSWVSRPFNK